jgi:hypothetical protein
LVRRATVEAVMIRHRAALLFALTLTAAVARASDGGLRAAEIPRGFSGEYRWRREETPSHVKLTIDRIEDEQGRIHFAGHDAYSRAGCRMKVDGVIDPRSRRVSFRESAPSAPRCVIDGSFEGTLSGDLRRIEAVWTTTSTGARGDLMLRAD